MKKTKSYYNINNINNNFYYYDKILKIIPSHDILTIKIVNNIINNYNNNNIICYNPECNNKLDHKIYCLYDCYYCSRECKEMIKDNIEFYWNKI